MPRFYRAPDVQNIDYVVPPVGGAGSGRAGGRVGEGLMPDLEVLEVDRPVLMDRLNEYQTQMDAFARELQQDPRALTRLRPKMQQLQKQVADDFKYGDVRNLLDRKREYDTNLAMAAKHFEGSPDFFNHWDTQYRSGFTPGGGISEVRDIKEMFYNKRFGDFDKHIRGVAKDIGTTFLGSDEIKKLGRVGATEVGVIRDIEARTADEIYGTLSNLIATDPGWGSWLEAQQGISGLGTEEVDLYLRETAKSLAREEVKSRFVTGNNPWVTAAANRAAKNTEKHTAWTDAVFDGALGADNPALSWKEVGAVDYRDIAFGDVGRYPLVPTANVGEAFKGRVTDEFNGMSVGRFAVSRAESGGTRFFDNTDDEAKVAINSAMSGRLLYVESDRELTLDPSSLSTQVVETLDRMGMNPATKLRPGKAYLEIKLGEGAIWVEVNPLGLHTILSNSVSEAKVGFDRWNEIYGTNTPTSTSQGGGTDDPVDMSGLWSDQ